jgi:aspartate--ammonia ligase
MLVLKDNYKSTLSMRDTQKAIKVVRDTFEDNLASRLNLERISAPLFVTKNSGINDDLNGVERAVSFDVKEMPEAGDVVIVHSLAKWKRIALKKYGFSSGEGFYTDMNAIRRDEDMDNLHSIYVDQWDWEKVVNKEDRNISDIAYSCGFNSLTTFYRSFKKIYGNNPKEEFTINE